VRDLCDEVGELVVASCAPSFVASSPVVSMTGGPSTVYLPILARLARSLDAARQRWRKALRSEPSPRHDPNRFVLVDVVLEAAPEQAISRASLYIPSRTSFSGRSRTDE
jgi:hypothetical protein